MRHFRIEVRYDDEASVWYVEDSDVPGLATEAESFDGMIAKLRIMVPELVDLNDGDDDDGELPEVPMDIIAHTSAAGRRVRAA